MSKSLYFRQLQPGETIPENAVTPDMCGDSMVPVACSGSVVLEREFTYFVPIEPNADPDAAARALYCQRYPTLCFNETHHSNKFWRESAQAVIEAGLPTLIARINELEEKLAAAKLDSERLDWLECNRFKRSEYMIPKGRAIWFTREEDSTSSSIVGESGFREAIDAARSEGK